MRPFSEHAPEITEINLNEAQLLRFAAFLMAALDDGDPVASLTWADAVTWGADRMTNEQALGLITKCIRGGAFLDPA